MEKHLAENIQYVLSVISLGKHISRCFNDTLDRLGTFKLSRCFIILTDKNGRRAVTHERNNGGLLPKFAVRCGYDVAKFLPDGKKDEDVGVLCRLSINAALFGNHTFKRGCAKAATVTRKRMPAQFDYKWKHPCYLTEFHHHKFKW